ncbi:hypothetical protein QVL73_07840, partial [Bartonella henselae]|nr:hypothetical protein [Bartonella henselae]
MIKIFKNYLSLCVFTTAIFFFVHNTDARVETSRNDGGHEISDKIYHKAIKSFAEKPANDSKSEGTVTGNTMAIEVSSPDIISGFVGEKTFAYNILSGSRKIRKRESGEKESRNLGSAALGKSESKVLLVLPMKLYDRGNKGFDYFAYHNSKNYVFKDSAGKYFRPCPPVVPGDTVSYLNLSSATDNKQCPNMITSNKANSVPNNSSVVVVEIMPEELYDSKKDINEELVIRKSDGSFKQHCPGGNFFDLSSATDKRECGSSVTDNVSDNSISVVDDQSTSRGRSESSGEAATGSISTPVKPTDGFVLPERVVRSVVPQVPTYLLLPNSLFHVGLMDIGDQNKQLETLRMSAGGMLEVHENPALFLRGYGGHYRYASDLS